MRLVKHLQYMKLLKLKMLILAEFFNVSLVVDFVAAATDVGAFFFVVVVAAVAAAHLWLLCLVPLPCFQLFFP